ncbi:MAG: hypothetical protein M3Q76_10655 [Acidobacteriota bacterium]|nr:hypothetical protein [Acidobacteriota bacterium]
MLAIGREQRHDHVNAALVNYHAEELSRRQVDRISLNVSTGQLAFDRLVRLKLADVRRLLRQAQ